MPVFRNVKPHPSARLGYGYPAVHSDNSILEAQLMPPSTPSHPPNHAPHDTYAPQPIVPSDAPFCTSSPPSFTSSAPSTFSPPAPVKRSSHARRRDPSHIPRPRNAFIIFRSTYIATHASARDSQNEISKRAAAVWNGMGDEEKEPFAHLAKLEKIEHMRKYPGYSYSPGRAPGRGNTVQKEKAKTAKSSRMRASITRLSEGHVREAPSPAPSSSTIASSSGPVTPAQAFAAPRLYSVPAYERIATPVDESSIPVTGKPDTASRPFNYDCIDAQFTGLHQYIEDPMGYVLSRMAASPDSDLSALISSLPTFEPTTSVHALDYSNNVPAETPNLPYASSSFPSAELPSFPEPDFLTMPYPGATPADAFGYGYLSTGASETVFEADQQEFEVPTYPDFSSSVGAGVNSAQQEQWSMEAFIDYGACS
ncbi:hypothetical protein NLJ89_g3828 [Agrocybe chaxingu]|uniref:HMG box domain-containing protein n=1 Tax=Agrocybe chaxingu TaxID=84603 RepID=A0A9W8K470_9AGAR|nr:hypothetical protein NLJ89_g3828 [Agrocybe chaxingu]